MSDKKHIDRVFQERFKKFEATPPPAVWDAIEKKINTAHKPGGFLIPAWLRYVSIAAVAVALFSLGSLLWYPFEAHQKPDSEPANTIEKITNQATENDMLDSQRRQNNQNNDTINSDLNGITNAKRGNSMSDQNPGAPNDKIVQENKFNQQKIVAKSSENTNRAATQTTSLTTIPNNTAQSQSTGKQAAAGREPRPSFKKEHTNAAAVVATYNTKAAQNNDQQTTSAAPNKVLNQVHRPQEATSDTTAGSKSVLESMNNIVAKTTNNTADALKTNELILQIAVPQDSSNVKKADLTEVAAKQDEIKQEETPVAFKKTWSGTPVIAPLFSSSMGGSSIGEDFKDNAKSPGFNVSYGVLVGYNVAPKLTVRTGVHQVNMSYTTQQINYGFDVQVLSAPLQFNRQAVTDLGQSQGRSAFSQELVSDGNTFNGLSGEISQRLAFVEVPLEVSYRLIDRKVSLNVTGGMSALFLTDNSVAVFDGAKRLDLGADSNFNDFHQSANLGLGLGYKFSDKLGAIVEPVFKYQLNALKRDVADFRPYNIGLYTGITFTF